MIKIVCSNIDRLKQINKTFYVLVIALEGGLYGIYGPRADCLLPERSEGNNSQPEGHKSHKARLLMRLLVNRILKLPKNKRNNILFRFLVNFSFLSFNVNKVFPFKCNIRKDVIRNVRFTFDSRSIHSELLKPIITRTFSANS